MDLSVYGEGGPNSKYVPVREDRVDLSLIAKVMTAAGKVPVREDRVDLSRQKAKPHRQPASLSVRTGWI